MEQNQDIRERNTKILEDKGILFQSKNLGRHLIVDTENGYIDFWPGTSKWSARSGETGVGILTLLKFIGV